VRNTNSAWQKLVVQQLDRHDTKLDKLLETVSGLKVKVSVGAGIIAIIVSIVVKFM